MAGSARRRAALEARSARKARAQEGKRLGLRELGAGAVAPVAIFELARLEAPIGHHQPVWDAEQLRVGELDARARVSVVVQHFDPGGGELGIQAVADLANTRGFLQVQRHQRSEEHTSELRSQFHLVCRLLLEKKKKT